MKKAISFLILLVFASFFLPSNAHGVQFSLNVDPNVTKNEAIIGKIRGDIATQFSIFEAYFGSNELSYHINVYPTYKSIGQIFVNQADSSAINIVLPGNFYKITEKTRTIYHDLLFKLYPSSSEGLRKAIAQFLSHEYYGINTIEFATVSRFSFHDKPLPKSIDAVSENFSLTDRLSAKFKIIAQNEGNASLGFFLDKALKNGLSFAVKEKYDQDFRAFVRSTPLLLVPKTFDKDLFAKIYNTESILWSNLPQNSIPLDTAWREDLQAKLELAKILILKNSKEEVSGLVSDVENTIKAESVESFSWWFIAGFLFLVIAFCFGLTLQLSASYGTIRKPSHAPPRPQTADALQQKPPKTYLVNEPEQKASSPPKPRFRGRPATRVDNDGKSSKNTKGRSNK